MNSYRISLRKMLVVVGLLGILMAIATQVGNRTVEFEILENELQLDDEQLVSGELRWGYRSRTSPENDQWPFVCQIRNVPQSDLLNLMPGQKNEVNYRAYPVWPLKQQDPFKIYIVKVLGIRSDRIVGYVMTSENTQVHIDGNRK